MAHNSPVRKAGKISRTRAPVRQNSGNRNPLECWFCEFGKLTAASRASRTVELFVLETRNGSQQGYLRRRRRIVPRVREATSCTGLDSGGPSLPASKGVHFCRRRPTARETEMSGWRKERYSLVLSWTALVGGSLIVFWASRGTQFEPLGGGLLCASVALLGAMAIFEIAWQAVIKAFNFPGQERPQRKEGSGHRERSKSRHRSQS